MNSNYFKLGIIGYPLGHTLSPLMHNAALKELGLDGDYGVYETHPDNLKEQLDYFRNNDFRGFNVTIPHKVSIMKYLDEIDVSAQTVGAVNTVLIKDGKLIGYNTDAVGFSNGIPEALRLNLKDKKAVVLGAGGAARAILLGLIELEVAQITVLARNIEKANELIKPFAEKYPNIKFSVNTLNLICHPELVSVSNKFDLSNTQILVNTTPLGMEGKFEGISPVDEIAIKSMPKDAIVYDIVYKPDMTELLKIAVDNDLAIIKGIEMLVLQGAKAFEILTGKLAPIDTMREVAVKSL